MKKAVVLLSGGLDSAVTGFLAKKDGCALYALTVNYGQRHLRELDSARKIARKLGVMEHKVINLDLRKFGGSALTDKKIKVPSGKTKGIPKTYVPARNTIMLSLALAYAEVVGADFVYIGVHHQDYSGYPDCRPKFIKAFQKMAYLATKRSIQGSRTVIKTPIISLTKRQIIEKGVKLHVPFKLTRSCYKEGIKSCGVCDSCTLRKQAFKQAGLKDPIEYEK